MALNRSITSLPSCVSVESEVEEDEESVAGGGPCCSSVVSADCALEMSLEERAESTLDRNFPNGLEESALEGVSSSTFVRYVLALEVSPD
jgi:hypothetical protein